MNFVDVSFLRLNIRFSSTTEIGLTALPKTVRPFDSSFDISNSESVGFQSLRPGAGDTKMHAPKNGQFRNLAGTFRYLSLLGCKAGLLVIICVNFWVVWFCFFSLCLPIVFHFGQSMAGRSVGRSLGSLESWTQNHVPSVATTYQRWERGKGEATGHGHPWTSMEIHGDGGKWCTNSIKILTATCH